ncbi:hypothetical protein B6U74_00290 [Candidatus Bathyarchaeota archaeon ex4484_205]|nr:MAG: hypothetical protein B6U74_00290 [Candidatus Bathyarchaeota archaeon ex4484_205]RLG69443.1 MAG: hypothetical protein DRN93_00030 [archaeon]
MRKEEEEKRKIKRRGNKLKIDKNIIKLTNLTRKQLEALLKYISNEKRDYILDKKRISKGAYHRILSQARQNIAKTLVTIAVLAMLNIINEEDILSLIEIGQELQRVEIEEQYRILKAISQKIEDSMKRRYK